VKGTLKLSGVVLRTVDYGESDRVVTLFTAERGKVAAFARGARASRRRFGGALELFTLVLLEARERARTDLIDLESAAVVRAFPAIRGDLTRIACAAYACDLARSLVREGEPHPELLGLLLDYLARLDGSKARPTVLRAYELKALEAVGLMPRLSSCAACSRPFRGEDGRLAFDPGEGGVLCPSCAGRAREVRFLAADTALALSQLQQGGLSGAEAVPLTPGAGREAREALAAFIEHQLGSRLESRRFLDEVGPMLEP